MPGLGLTSQGEGGEWFDSCGELSVSGSPSVVSFVGMSGLGAATGAVETTTLYGVAALDASPYFRDHTRITITRPIGEDRATNGMLSGGHRLVDSGWSHVVSSRWRRSVHRLSRFRMVTAFRGPGSPQDSHHNGSRWQQSLHTPHRFASCLRIHLPPNHLRVATSHRFAQRDQFAIVLLRVESP